MTNPQSTFRNTSFHGPSILATRRKTIARTTIKTQLDQFRQTGTYSCFELKWHPTYEDKNFLWPVPLHLFWDSDLAKWIEGACYFLASEHDEEIDAAVKYMVETIRSAQGEDGYLNLHHTVVDPKGRWSNLRDLHELYNCGHLIEAALAHKDHYKNDLLLEPIEKYVRLIRKVFGPGEDQLHGFPGHPEIELALVRLYKATGNQDAYDLAQYFVEERGNPTGQEGKHYHDWEAEKRGDSAWLRPNHYSEARAHWYCQAHVPLLEQTTIEGHSVRALYLLTAVADLLAVEKSGQHAFAKSDQWLATVKRLWDNMVDRKMYVTGGVGAIKQWEGFGGDYFLPQGTDEGGCYAETCASIAVMFLAERMLELELDGRYGDMMELCLYNSVMTGMSLDGKSFTYVNQLASSDKDKSGRESWFWCACCPPNFSRLFGSLGGYLWHYGSNGNGTTTDDVEAFINVHLYTTAKLTFQVSDAASIEFEQKTNWPWEGNILFQMKNPAQIKTTIRLRIPAWAKGKKFTLTPSSPSSPMPIENGYITLDPAYVAANPAFSLQIHGFEPRYIEPHPYTNQRTLTLARGPIIYCVEDADNTWETNHFKDVVIKRDSAVREEQRPDDGGYVALHSTCWKRSLEDWETTTTVQKAGVEPGREVGTEEMRLEDEREIVFVPYYYRANRGGKGHMRVGLLRG
ncbi:hypothetical protein AJ80_04729 [Polytolypa hystricis UAMH7299]|uniref:DUF1680 domain-containing protein n=1 Tax=Polytolypa hystricis (strain UAMH7299) TaxID=1447883 RepID=A0A2B7Y9I0_POLH7|nr:hypothetical protein AJ80_04729 [Polytolypa hystricis UAMH7299]